MSFRVTILTTFLKTFFLNCHKKTHVSNLMHSQGEKVNFFPQKRGAQKYFFLNLHSYMILKLNKTTYKC